MSASEAPRTRGASWEFILSQIETFKAQTALLDHRFTDHRVVLEHTQEDVEKLKTHIFSTQQGQLNHIEAMLEAICTHFNIAPPESSYRDSDGCLEVEDADQASLPFNDLMEEA